MVLYFIILSVQVHYILLCWDVPQGSIKFKNHRLEYSTWAFKTCKVWIPLIQVTPKTFALGSLTMPHSSHSISSKSSRIFFGVSLYLGFYLFYSVVWRFKKIIHPFGALGTRTNVLFEALVANPFPFLLLLHSPRYW